MDTERTIRNCRVALKVVCPKSWNELAETARADVRHCSQCNEDIYFCATDAETIAHGKAGHCIARERPMAYELGVMQIGRPDVERKPPTESQRVALAMIHRERGIDKLLQGRIEGAERTCPSCSYPVPEYRVSCYVCGHELGRAL